MVDTTSFPYRLVKMKGKIVVIAATRELLEAAAAELEATGIKGVTKIEPFGREYALSCLDPDDESDHIAMENMGMRTIIKGPSELAVSKKLGELVRTGARLISAPTEATDGRWFAVCDNIDQARK